MPEEGRLPATTGVALEVPIEADAPEPVSQVPAEDRFRLLDPAASMLTRHEIEHHLHAGDHVPRVPGVVYQDPMGGQL
jgi:hypothetical protein